MTLLDAINTVLSSIGENMVLSLESSNPTMGLVKKKIENTTTELLSSSWWFNTSTYIAYPDSQGEVQVGMDVIDVEVHDGSGDIVIIDEKGNLYNQTKQTPYFKASTLKLTVLRDMQFEKLPIPVQTYIAYQTASQVYADDLGIDNKYAQLSTMAKDAKAVMNRINLAKKKFNTGQSPMYKRISRGIRF